jgi:hypothetical protein
MRAGTTNDDATSTAAPQNRAQKRAAARKAEKNKKKAAAAADSSRGARVAAKPTPAVEPAPLDWPALQRRPLRRVYQGDPPTADIIRRAAFDDSKCFTTST